MLLPGIDLDGPTFSKGHASGNYYQNRRFDRVSGNRINSLFFTALYFSVSIKTKLLFPKYLDNVTFLREFTVHVVPHLSQGASFTT